MTQWKIPISLITTLTPKVSTILVKVFLLKIWSNVPSVVNQWCMTSYSALS